MGDNARNGPIALADAPTIQYPVIMFRYVAASILILTTLAWAKPLTAQQNRQLNNNPPAQPAAQPAAAQYRYWTTHWSLQDVAIGELVGKLRMIGVDVPVKVDGLASVEFDVSVPLNALRTGRAYRIEGSLTIRDLEAARVRYDLFGAEVRFADGRLVLNQLRLAEQLDASGTTVAGTGSVVGSATADLIPRGQFEAKIKTANLKIGPITDLIARLALSSDAGDVGGTVSADVALSGNVDDIGSPNRWTIAGDVAATGLRRGDLMRFNFEAADLRLDQQSLAVPRLRIESPDRPEFFVSADANIAFNDSTTFEANLSANDLPLDQVLGLAMANPERVVVGKLDAQGSVTGSLGPTGMLDAIDLRLALASPSVTAGGVRLGLVEHDLRLTRDHVALSPRGTPQSVRPADMIIQSFDADYELSESVARFSNLNANLFGGSITGSGQFAKKAELSHQVDIRWDNINPEISLPYQASAGNPRLRAETSGEIRWSVDASDVLRPSNHKGTVSISVSTIRIDEESLGQTELAISLDPTRLDVSLDGRLFGGVLTVRTTAPIDASTRWGDIPAKLEFSDLKFDNLSLRGILKLATSRHPRFDGRISMSVDPVIPPAGDVTGNVTLQLEGLTADGVLVARTLSANLVVGRDRILVTSAGGTYARGLLELDGEWALGRGTKLLTARLTRADGSRILLPVHEDAIDWVGGTISGRATIAGRGGGLIDTVRITGAVSVADGTTFSMPVGDAHSAIDVTVGTVPFLWRASFPKIRSSLSGGRVTGELVFRSAGAGRSGFHMDSDWRMTHVDFESLLSSHIGTSTIGRGDLTGTFRLGGRNIRGARDLEGQMRVRLGGTDATAVPGLSTAGSLLGATSLIGVRFEQGEAVGRISNGSLLLTNVSMTSDRVDVQANGSVGLLDRRLDIDAVISTGSFQGQNALIQQFTSQALLDVIPIGKVNRILSDRTIVIQMTGPTRDPIIRLMTGETLRANTRRFAIQEALGIVVADSLLID